MDNSTFPINQKLPLTQLIADSYFLNIYRRQEMNDPQKIALWEDAHKHAVDH